MSPRKNSEAAPRVAAASRISFLVVASSFVALTLSATTIVRLSLEQVRDHARSVVVGRVVSSSQTSGRFPTMDYGVAVTEVLRGSPGQRSMTVSYLRAEGAPQLQEGRTYVFFMSPKANHSTVGWAQGLYRMERIAQSGKTVQVLISGDNQPLLMTASGEIKRGSIVDVREGRLRPVAASVTQWHSELPSEPGVAEKGVPVSTQRPPAVSQSAPQITRYATLDDLRRFVGSGRAPRH